MECEDRAGKDVHRNVFLSVATVVFLGFLPSPFRPLATATTRFPWQIHFHAFCMASWIILALAQTFLIQKDSFGAHRAIGKISYTIVSALILSSLLVIRWSTLKNLKVAPQSNGLAKVGGKTPWRIGINAETA